MVAVKVLKGPHDFGRCKQLLQELSVWSAVQHEHITPFMGITFDFDRPYTPCLVSPLYRYGHIIGYLKERPNINKLALLAQIASALSHLHSLSIVHGDLKGSNILIDDGGNARLADFGLARFLLTSGYTRTRPSGTVRWMALELFAASEAREEQSDPQVTTESDVWAFGLTAIEIFSNSVPFSHIRLDMDVMFHILRGGRPDRAHYLEVNDDTWGILESCWHEKPNGRPRMSDISTFLSPPQNTEVVGGMFVLEYPHDLSAFDALF